MIKRQKFSIFFVLFFVVCVLYSLGIYSSSRKTRDTRYRIKSFWGEVVKDDFLVNDDTLGGCNQSSQDMVATKFGYVLTWIDSRKGNDLDIYGCKLDPNGILIGSAFLVNDDRTSSNQTFPSVEADSVGNFVIVWEDARNGNKDIYGQMYDVTGIPIDSNFLVNDDGVGKWQYTPEICMSPEGDFVVAWRDDRRQAPDIYCQSYDKFGAKVGSNFIVNDDTLPRAFQCYPNIAYTDDSAFAVVWLDTRDRVSAVYCQKYVSWGTPVDSNFKINDNIGSANMKSPNIASNGKGKIVVAWEDYREHLSYPNIYCQEYDSLWNAVDTNFCVNADTGSSRQEIPYVKIDVEGNVIIVWSDKRDDPQNPSVYGQRYDKLGNPDGSNFKINTNSLGGQWYAHSVIAIRKGKESFVVWDDCSGKDTELIGQKYASNGTSVDTNFFVIPDNGMRDQTNSQVAMCTNGDFIITWEDERLYNTCVFAQRYDEDGIEVGANFLVNDDTSKITYSPGVAIDSAGNFIITWFYRKNWKGAIYLGDICARRYNNTGVPIDSEFVVNADVDAPRCVPQVATDKTGNFVIVWEDARNDSKRPDIYARIYLADGTPVDTNFGVNESLGVERSEAPAIAMTENGEFVVIWHEGQGDVGLFNIYGQRYDSAGNSVDMNFEISDDPIPDNQQMNPSVAMINDGDFVAVWEDMREGNQDIYGQRYVNWAPLGSNFRINDDVGSASQEIPAVTINSDSGNFLVTWADYREENSQIMAQEFDSGGNPIGINFQVNNLENGHRLSSGEGVASCKDKIVFAWTDNRRLRAWDIYAKLVKWRVVKIEEKKTLLKFSLQNYPNPVSKKLSIKYSIAKKGIYKISIYDKSGRMVKNIVLPNNYPGTYITKLNVSNFSSGVYFIKFKGDNVSMIDKVIILR